MEIAPVLLDVREGGGFEDFSCTQQHQYLFVMSVTYRPFIVDLLFFTKDQPSATCRRVRNCPPPSLRRRCWSSEPAFQFIPQQTCPPPGILHRIRVQYELRMHLVLNWPDRYPTIYLAGERSFLALNSRGKKGFSKNHIYFSKNVQWHIFNVFSGISNGKPFSH